MHYIKFLLPLLLILCAFCKKDNPPQVELILLNGTWVQYEYLTDDNTDGVFTDNSLPCQFGDGWKFTADHKFELRDEVEYCDTDVDSVSIIRGIWELRNSDTEIFVAMESSFQDFNFKIQSINDTLMELRIYNTPSSQAPLEERIILRR